MKKPAESLSRYIQKAAATAEPSNIIKKFLTEHPHLVAGIQYATLSAVGLIALKLILPTAIVAAIGKLGLAGVRIALGTHLGQAASAAAISGAALVTGLFFKRKNRPLLTNY